MCILEIFSFLLNCYSYVARNLTYTLTNVGVYIIWQMVRYSSLDTLKTTEIGDEIFQLGTSRILDLAAANVVFSFTQNTCVL